MSLFDTRSASPMLLTEEKEPIDKVDWIYELKLDGIRALAYIDENGTEIRNKRNLRVDPIYPELSEIHKQVKSRCILDGEILIMENGRPNFERIKRRALMSKQTPILLAAQKLPASFIAYDILYADGQELLFRPLEERKEMLSKIVSETERLSVSRWIPEKGTALYQQAEKNELEGIVCKRLGSLYKMGKRSKDWIKVKYLKDEDFIICGYIDKPNGLASLIIAQDRDGESVYQGRVTMGISREEMRIIKSQPRYEGDLYAHFPQQPENTVWIEPKLSCSVKYMQRLEREGLRQTVFKQLKT